MKIEEQGKNAAEDLSRFDDVKHKYNVTDKQVKEAIDAVGNEKIKVEAYLKEAFGEAQNYDQGIAPGGIAVNPNPKANANIKGEIKNKTSSQLEEEKAQPGNEITDGEDG